VSKKVEATEAMDRVFEGNSVRMKMIDGQPWFCAKDVGTCLGMSHARSRRAVADLHDEDKGVRSTHTLGGSQMMTFLSEPGVYGMILQSRKAAARRFHHWLTHDVLPSIARTGRYELATKSPAEVIAAGWKALEAQLEVEKQGRLTAEATAAARLPAQRWVEDLEAGGNLVVTRDAVRQASVPGSDRLTKGMWIDLDGHFFVVTREGGRNRRTWRAGFAKGSGTSLGVNVPTRVREDGKPALVIVPKWTPKGVKYLREWLLDRKRQVDLPRSAAVKALDTRADQR
jgi:prophage antirepressor-like protein